jgi:molybdate transport system substrate-binding protein
VTRRRLILLTVASVLLAACGGGDSGSETTTLVVFTDVLVQKPVEALEAEFEDENPGVDLQLEVGVASELADRVRAGERADIFIGNQREVDQLRAEEVILGESLLLGSDLMQIVVPEGNPADAVGLEDFLAESPTRTAICDELSVCGAYARAIFTKAGIPAAPDRDDANPVEILYLLGNREIDAAILWRTQAAAAGEPLDHVAIPLEYEERSDFSVAGVEDNPTVERTVRWLAADPVANEILVARGLRSPTEESAS